MDYRWIPSPNPKHHIHDTNILLPEQQAPADEESILMKAILSQIDSRIELESVDERPSTPFSISPIEGEILLLL
jgi:hypothetical protein